LNKTAALAVMVPQSRDEVSKAILEIGVRQRERTRIAATMNDKIAAIKARYETEAEPHSAAIVALSEGIKIWCAANRSELTRQEKVKTHAFAGGEVRWRMTPPRVVSRGAEAALAALKRAAMTQFIRIKEEISKEAILADADAVASIPGISFQQIEEFVIVPFETTLEEVL
jgi:phage host-nuclease inhibitor protein Gam